MQSIRLKTEHYRRVFFQWILPIKINNSLNQRFKEKIYEKRTNVSSEKREIRMVASRRVSGSAVASRPVSRSCVVGPAGCRVSRSVVCLSCVVRRRVVCRSCVVPSSRGHISSPNLKPDFFPIKRLSFVPKGGVKNTREL